MGNVIPKAQIETKQGEILVTINLNLNIKLDQDGKILLDNQIIPIKPIENKVKFEKPKLEENNEIIDFGKKM